MSHTRTQVLLSLYASGFLSLACVIPCLNSNDPLIVPSMKLLRRKIANSQSPTTIFYIAVRHKARMGLQQDIRSLLSHASEKPGFVSLESLEGCLTEQKVKDHINSINISISPEELKAIFTMPRLFAILVLLGSEKATVALMEEIEDDTFFYCAEEVPSKVGDNDQRAQFSELQSQFPPMLSCRDPPQEFPDSFRPPFTDELQKGPSGSYGIVRKVKIAGGHLPGHSSVSCQYIKFLIKS